MPVIFAERGLCLQQGYEHLQQTSRHDLIRPTAAHLLARAAYECCRGVEGIPLRAPLRGRSKLGSPLGTSPQHVCNSGHLLWLETCFPGTVNQTSRIAMESMSGQQQQDVGFKIPALPAQLEGLRHNVACGLQAAGQQLTRAAHGIRWDPVWQSEATEVPGLFSTLLAAGQLSHILMYTRQHADSGAAADWNAILLQAKAAAVATRFRAAGSGALQATPPAAA